MLILHLFDHNGWANRSLLEFCQGLSPEQLAAEAVGTRGRLDDTLVHVIAAEQRYLRSLGAGEADHPLREGERPPVAELLQRADENAERWQRLLAGKDEDWLGGAYETEYRGEKSMLRRAVVINQALQHGNDHRSHCCVILTRLGLQPPELDSWHHDEAQARGEPTKGSPQGPSLP